MGALEAIRGPRKISTQIMDKKKKEIRSLKAKGFSHQAATNIARDKEVSSETEARHLPQWLHRCETREEALKLIEGLPKSQDPRDAWSTFPYDDPTKGLWVIGASRVVHNPDDPEGPGIPQDEFFEWPMFGQELSPSDREVSLVEFIEFARSEPLEFLFCADDPRALKLGLVSYRLANEGVALVRRVKLSQFKARVGVPDEDMEFIQGLRTQLMGAQKDERVSKASLLLALTKCH